MRRANRTERSNASSGAPWSRMFRIEVSAIVPPEADRTCKWRAKIDNVSPIQEGFMNVSRWAPASLLALKEYSLATFAHDLSAGITVGLVALPLAMAFAIASGLTPQAGIYTAIAGGFIVSALGGSRIPIGGG